MRDSLFRMSLVLGLLVAVGPFAIDMYLPALPEITGDLVATEASAGLTLAVYLLTYGLAQMIYGPMSDAIGRKRPMIIGVWVFAVATVGAALAPSIGWLIAARALQGVGAAALLVVPRAMVRDVANGPAAARVMAAIMMVLAVSPMLAPLAGSLVLSHGSWRHIFWLLAIASLLCLPLILFGLSETLPPVRQRPMQLALLRKQIKHLLRDPRFMGLTMMGSFGLASLFLFVSMASFVYIQHYGLSPTGFSLAFAVNAIGFSLASQFAGRLSEKFGMERVISCAVSGFATSALLLVALIWLRVDALPVLMTGLFLVFTFLGLVVPTAMVMSLDPHPEIAGLAASIGGTAQMLTGAVVVSVAAPFMDSNALTMVLAIAVCAVLAWGSLAWSRQCGQSLVL